MKKEQYIKAVLHRLHCTGRKKKEIEKELLADIQNAMEEGESWEEIRARMGTPVEAAGEFNENFSQQEIKSAKRNKMLLVLAVGFCILACLVAVVWWILPKGSLIDNEDYSGEETLSRVKKIIALFEEGDYDTIRDEYADDTVKSLITDGQLDAAKVAIGSDWGKCVSFGKFYVSNVEQMGEEYTVTQLSVSYENASVTYTITLDEDGKMSGFYIK